MRRTAAVAPSALVLLVALASSPRAQPAGITRTELGRGTVEDDYEVEGFGGSDVVVQSVTIDPGGASGWHTHPGAEIAIVKAGRLTFFDADDPDCDATTYGPGQVLVRLGHPHLARNLTDELVEIVVTYVDVPAGAPAAAPAEEPAHCAGR